MNAEPQFNKKTSKCILCSRCGDTCSWMDNMTPIEGWTAQKTICEGEKTYRVIACPIFIAQKGIEEKAPRRKKSELSVKSKGKYAAKRKKAVSV